MKDSSISRSEKPSQPAEFEENGAAENSNVTSQEQINHT